MTWDEWLREHLKACETCRKAFEEMEGGMCEEAFAKFKEFMRTTASS